jgi:uncharacterized protein (DUF934 family)
MPRLIDRSGELVPDTWTLLAKDCSLEQALAEPAGQLIVPLQLWLGAAEALRASGKQLGVWLDSEEQASALAPDLSQFPLVALNFPVFADGRNYTNATRLRQHYHYAGEIRAIGDVLRDQLFYLRRCGFSSFALRDSVKLEDARKALQDFHDSYQSTVEQPLPLFRRRPGV